MAETSTDHSASANTALTKSLNRVKSKLALKFKNSDSVEPGDFHVLKAMKYDDLEYPTCHNSHSARLPSRSNSLQTAAQVSEDQIHPRLTKSLSLTSVTVSRSRTNSAISLNPILTGTSNVDQLISSETTSKRGSSTTLDPVYQINSTVSSRKSSSDYLSNSRRNSNESTREQETHQENLQEVLIPRPPLHSPPISTTNGLISPLDIINETDGENELNIHLKSPFHQPTLSTKLDQQLLASPPLSPKRANSLCCDPLHLTKPEVKLDPLPEPQPNDYADAMAASILDKVDDSNTDEWKI